MEHIGAPTEAERTAALAHLQRFVADVAQLGVTEGADNLFLGDLRTVSFEISELFDQTPGRSAGEALT